MGQGASGLAHPRSQEIANLAKTCGLSICQVEFSWAQFQRFSADIRTAKASKSGLQIENDGAGSSERAENEMYGGKEDGLRRLVVGLLAGDSRASLALDTQTPLVLPSIPSLTKSDTRPSQTTDLDAFTQYIYRLATWRKLDYASRTKILFLLLDVFSANLLTPTSMAMVARQTMCVKIQLGDCVKVRESARRGAVRFIGPTAFGQGVWAGLELDVASGTHDGSVDGIAYFQTAKNHGAFVKLEFIELESMLHVWQDVFAQMGANVAQSAGKGETGIDLDSFGKLIESMRLEIMVDPLPPGLA